MPDELSDREQALRKLPLPYSLALRLRDAGVDAEVICEYLDVEQASLNGIYRLAAAKLRSAQQQLKVTAGALARQPVNAPLPGQRRHA